MGRIGGGFSAEFVERLRSADQRLSTIERGQHATRYAVCRTTISELTRVDSFYIGFYRDEDTIFIPYIYDHNQFLRPDIGTFGKQGVSFWVRASKRPYLHSDDDGARLANAIPFGDETEVSRDAAVVPLLDAGNGDVAGLMSIQSLEPDVYDDEVVRAFDWLGRALMHSFARDAAEQDELDLYSIYPELNSANLRNELDLIGEVNVRLDRIHDAIGGLADRASDDSPAIADDARQLLDLCEQLQVEIGDLVGQLRSKAPAGPDPKAGLTSREAEIAELIAQEGLSNAELADRLHISQKTVKTHVGNVLRKLGVAQRSAIAWTLGMAGPHDATPSQWTN
ncbi:LuxR C-terminal-related transcriptional regulator [Flexivirga meconopsidis]|uniref:LuxR C-terminal-related transcriptional regulator n=1 Tax=Flexivirga meconopsidis TaxID=2977121 RepID=UPI00223F168B|nr:LuxR C-terminal-related transcriptional regulator [Flexivirga meconopsidis]